MGSFWSREISDLGDVSSGVIGGYAPRDGAESEGMGKWEGEEVKK